MTQDEYKVQLERAFTIIKKDVESHEKGSTTKKDVLQYMIDTKDEITWHPSYSFQENKTSTGGFLSHRSCARASELGIENPNLVEVRKVGRIHVYRLRRENPKEIQEFMRK